MPTSPILQINQVASSQSNKEVTINDAVAALEGAGNATLVCDYGAAAADKVLSVAQFTRHFVFKATNASAGAKLVVPHLLSGQPASRVFAVHNASGQAITVTTNQAGGDTAVVPDQATRLVMVAGVDVLIAAQTAATSNLKDLLDVPPSYLGQAKKTVRVKTDETGVEYHLTELAELGGVNLGVGAITNGSRLTYDSSTGKWIAIAPTAVVTNFLALSDTPDTFAGMGGRFVRVNIGANGLEFVSSVGPDTLTDLLDFPSNYTGAELQALRVNAAGTAVEFYTPSGGGGGSSTFLELTDTPDDFTGNALRPVRVNAAGTALEFYTPALPPYNFGGFAKSAILPSEILLDHLITRSTTLAANLAGTRVSAGTNPSAPWVGNLFKNGAVVGTITISTAGLVTLATSGGTPVNLVAGDLVTFAAPAVSDATIERLRYTFLGT